MKEVKDHSLCHPERCEGAAEGKAKGKKVSKSFCTFSMQKDFETFSLIHLSTNQLVNCTHGVFMPSSFFCRANISSRRRAASIKSISRAAFSISFLVLAIAFPSCGMVV